MTEKNTWLSAWIENSAKKFCDGIGVRQDASYTAMMAQQLEHLMARTFDIKYPELKSKMFIPVNHDTPSGAETVSYVQHNMYGAASIGGNYSDDIRLVNVDGRKFTHSVVPVKSAYELSIQDLRAAAMAGVPLETKMISTCMRVIEQAIDTIAAFGHASAGMTGFLNNATAVSNLVSPDTGTWSTATPEEIIGDVTKLWNAVPDQTSGVHRCNALLLDNTSWGYISRPMTYGLISVKQWLVENLEGLEFIDKWYHLDTADVAGTGPRIVAYQRDPNVVELDIPQEFEQFEPQQKNLAFVVPCHARCAGVKIYYPMAIAYMDGV